MPAQAMRSQFLHLAISVLQRMTGQFTANLGLWPAMPDTDISVFPYSVSSKHLAVMNSSVSQRCQRYPVWDKGRKWEQVYYGRGLQLYWEPSCWGVCSSGQWAACWTLLYIVSCLLELNSLSLNLTKTQRKCRHGLVGVQMQGLSTGLLILGKFHWTSVSVVACTQHECSSPLSFHLNNSYIYWKLHFYCHILLLV